MRRHVAPRSSSPASPDSPWRAAAAEAASRKPAEDPGPSGEAQQAIDELDANARPHDPADDIEQLLRERATALEAEDILALEATATGRQRAADRRSARRGKQLLIERIRYAVDDLQIDGAAATARVAHVLPGARACRARSITAARS